MPEKEKELKKKIEKIMALLKKEYPKPKIALNFSTPLELLIATILSAQCTDERVNKVTKILFKKYKKPEDYAKVDLKKFQEELSSISFYKNKAKNIKDLSKILVEKFNSEVPKRMDELLILPGVARKTANIVLFSGFGKNEGIAVDTHVKRVSQRLALTKENAPEKIEQDLIKLIPQKERGTFALRLISHGRRICQAKKPHCQECTLNNLCPSAFSF